MTETLIIALSILVALAVGFLIHTLLEVRKAASELREFINTTSKSLDATLKEADMTFKSARAITDSINDMAYDAKNISHRLTDTARSIGSVAQAVGGATTKTRLSTVALGAGIKAAFDVLSKRIVHSNEGGSHGTRN